MSLFRLRSVIREVPLKTSRTLFEKRFKEAMPQLWITLGAFAYLLFHYLTGIADEFWVAPLIAWIIFIAGGGVTLANFSSLLNDVSFFAKKNQLLNGSVAAVKGDDRKTFLIAFTADDKPRYWETGALDAEELQEGAAVKVAWKDEYLQRAALVRKDGSLEGLSRSFLRREIKNASPEFSVLHCPGCGVALPLSKEDHFACPSCGATVTVSKAQQQALAGAEQIATDTQRIVAEWESLAKIRLRPALYRLLNALPFLLVAFGLLLLLADSLHAPEGDSPLLQLLHRPAIKLSYWTFVIAVTIAGAWYSSRNLWANDVRSMMQFFAARRPSNERHSFSCRTCGSPLSLRDNAALCVCPYCHSENFILPDETRSEELQQRAATFQFLLEDSVQLGRLRRANGRFFSIGRAIGLGLLALPLYFLYDGSGIRPPDAWTIAIAADIFFLGICAYWIFREAWLPPVSDNDWLPDAFDSEEKKQARAQGDFSMEKQNFWIPLLLVAVYVAAEIFAAR